MTAARLVLLTLIVQGCGGANTVAQKHSCDGCLTAEAGRGDEGDLAPERQAQRLFQEAVQALYMGQRAEREGRYPTALENYTEALTLVDVLQTQHAGTATGRELAAEGAQLARLPVEELRGQIVPRVRVQAQMGSGVPGWTRHLIEQIDDEHARQSATIRLAHVLLLVGDVQGASRLRADLRAGVDPDDRNHLRVVHQLDELDQRLDHARKRLAPLRVAGAALCLVGDAGCQIAALSPIAQRLTAGSSPSPHDRPDLYRNAQLLRERLEGGELDGMEAEILALGPGHHRMSLLHRLGVALRRAGHTERHRLLMDLLITDHVLLGSRPGNVRALTWLAEELHAAGDRDRAARLLRLAETHVRKQDDGQRQRERLAIAASLAKVGRGEEARRLAKEAGAGLDRLRQELSGVDFAALDPKAPQTQALRTKHKRYHATLQGLAGIHHELREFDEALALADRELGEGRSLRHKIYAQVAVELTRAGRLDAVDALAARDGIGSWAPVVYLAAVEALSERLAKGQSGEATVNLGAMRAALAWAAQAAFDGRESLPRQDAQITVVLRLMNSLPWLPRGGTLAAAIEQAAAELAEEASESVHRIQLRSALAQRALEVGHKQTFETNLEAVLAMLRDQAQPAHLYHHAVRPLLQAMLRRRQGEPLFMLISAPGGDFLRARRIQVLLEAHESLTPEAQDPELPARLLELTTLHVREPYHRAMALRALVPACARAGCTERLIGAAYAADQASRHPNAVPQVAAALAEDGQPDRALRLVQDVGQEPYRSRAAAQLARDLARRPDALRQAPPDFLDRLLGLADASHDQDPGTHQTLVSAVAQILGAAGRCGQAGELLERLTRAAERIPLLGLDELAVRCAEQGHLVTALEAVRLVPDPPQPERRAPPDRRGAGGQAVGPGTRSQSGASRGGRPAWRRATPGRERRHALKIAPSPTAVLGRQRTRRPERGGGHWPRRRPRTRAAEQAGGGAVMQGRRKSREERREDRREAIKRAAIEVFREKGYHAAKVSEIVDCVGVAQGTFYLYYESKQQIFGELLHDFLEVVLTTIAGWEPGQVETREDLRNGLTEVGMVLTEVIMEHDGLATIFFKEALAVAPEFDALIHEFYDTLSAMLTDFNRILCKRGLIAPMNFRLAGMMTIGMVERTIYEYVVTSRLAHLAPREVVDHLVLHFLEGTRAPVPTESNRDDEILSQV